MIWTIIPAAILVFIALYQMGTWASIKFRSAAPKVQPLAEVTGRQFQWVMRYPGPDGRLHTPDDLHMVNDLHFVKGKTALIYLKSTDVLHSFFLPQLRIKQDAVPGLTIPVWFDADRAGQLRAGLRRAVRLGPLQDARERDGPRDPVGIRRVAETGPRASRTASQFDRGRRPRGEITTTMSNEHAVKARHAPAAKPRSRPRARRHGHDHDHIHPAPDELSSSGTSSRTTTRSSASSSCSRA